MRQLLAFGLHGTCEQNAGTVLFICRHAEYIQRTFFGKRSRRIEDLRIQIDVGFRTTTVSAAVLAASVDADSPIVNRTTFGSGELAFQRRSPTRFSSRGTRNAASVFTSQRRWEYYFRLHPDEYTGASFGNRPWRGRTETCRERTAPIRRRR